MGSTRQLRSVRAAKPLPSSTATTGAGRVSVRPNTTVSVSFTGLSAAVFRPGASGTGPRHTHHLCDLGRRLVFRLASLPRSPSPRDSRAHDPRARPARDGEDRSRDEDDRRALVRRLRRARPARAAAHRSRLHLPLDGGAHGASHRRGDAGARRDARWFGLLPQADVRLEPQPAFREPTGDQTNGAGIRRGLRQLG
jgi:hypothetical protein